ncbi:MAG: ATP-binding protein [Acidimicrobiales bacterium]
MKTHVDLTKATIVGNEFGNAIVDRLPVGILLLSPGGEVVALNRSAKRLIGPEAVDGWLRDVGAADAVAALSAEHPAPVTREGSHERAGGPSALLRVVVSAERLDDSGRFVAVIEDITEENRRRVMMTREADELRRSNLELESFAALAAHDLQEPLRKIHAFGDLLSADCGDRLDERGRLLLDRLLGASRRMSRRIEALLAYARLHGDAAPPVRVDLTTVAEAARSRLRQRLEEVGGTVDVGQLPVVAGIPTKLEQLFDNLFSNAIKYRSAHRALHVTVRAEGTTVEVADNGIGFDPEYAERVFAPFARLHAHSDYEGTGIGLAICRRIAEVHGWTLTAHPTPDEGTQFRLETTPPGHP